MKKNKLPSLITVLVLTLITAVMWVGLSVYRALSQKPAPAVPQEVSNPLTPTLDTDSLTKIQSRIFLDDTQIPEITVTSSAAPVPTTEPTSLPSPSPIPSPTPATESATI